LSIGRFLGCIALVELVAGCYVLQPVTGAGPEPGAMMAFEVNDLGRLSLGGQMGPEIAHIEGRLLSKQGDEYELSVRSVKLIRGGSQVWNGERVTIKKEFISQTFERHFSKSQTIALSTVFVVSVYLIARQANLFGLGRGEPDKPPCDTNCVPAARFPRRP
jgi:hypothetical protein